MPSFGRAVAPGRWVGDFAAANLIMCMFVSVTFALGVGGEREEGEEGDGGERTRARAGGCD